MLNYVLFTGVDSVTRHLAGVDFVTKHRAALIQRVSNVEPILDYLLDLRVIQHEEYNNVRAKGTDQAKMRDLMYLLDRRGNPVKHIFYKGLETNEPYLLIDMT